MSIKPMLPIVLAEPQTAAAPRSASRPDLARVLRVVLLGGVVLAAIVTVRGNLGSQYGFDFRGIWRAAAEMLNGHSPYPAPVIGALARTGNPYVLPPLLGLLVIPLSQLSFTFAVVTTNVLSVASLIGALHLLGVRDLRVYVIALCCFPFISSLALGQPDGMFALLGAAAWRYRDSPWARSPSPS